jgi:hypothetical protein
MFLAVLRFMSCYVNHVFILTEITIRCLECRCYDFLCSRWYLRFVLPFEDFFLLAFEVFFGFRGTDHLSLFFHMTHLSD